MENFFIFFKSKIAIYLFLGLQKERTSYRRWRAFSPQKRTSSTSKHEKSLLFSILGGAFLPSWIRIGIQQLKLMQIQIRIHNPEFASCLLLSITFLGSAEPGEGGEAGRHNHHPEADREVEAGRGHQRTQQLHRRFTPLAWLHQVT